MVSHLIVRIITERIINKGLNPNTNKTYVIDDITNQDYRQAVEDYILTATEGV